MVKAVKRIAQDVLSFATGKDLVVFATGIALSNALQSTVNSVITSLVMPFVSYGTGVTNLSTRSYALVEPEDDSPGIKLNWGTALNSVLTFVITTVIMVEFARYVTTRWIKTTTIQWAPRT